MDSVISSCITGGLALIGIIVTNIMSNRKIEAQLQISQAVTDTKIENLTHEVRQHNGFAEKIPILEERIKVINHRLEDLEKS